MKEFKQLMADDRDCLRPCDILKDFKYWKDIAWAMKYDDL